MGKTKGDAGRKYRESRRKKSYLDVYNVCYKKLYYVTFPVKTKFQNHLTKSENFARKVFEICFTEM